MEDDGKGWTIWLYIPPDWHPVMAAIMFILCTAGLIYAFTTIAILAWGRARTRTKPLTRL